MTDRREFKARVLGADSRSDVALLKVEASDLPRLAMGDSSKIRVGEWVIAIGSPFNLDSTVTAGIISAKARDTGDYLPLIQSDVAVNPGNSGGPLINMRGEVIGINSQIATMSGGYNGISFAVPIDEVMRVAQQLRENGRVRRGRLGVQIGDISKEVADTLGLGQPRGVEVAMVEARGPASASGIHEGDIILRFNGQGIEKTTDLIRLVGASTIGSSATVSIWRRGVQQDITVKVAEMPEPKAPRKPAPKAAKPGKVTSALGARVSDIPEALRRALKVDGGVLVDAAEGPAARAGLRAGDLILQLNKVEIGSAKAFNALAASLDPNKPAALLVRRGESTQYLVVRARQ
jgi:serine protease Do